MTKFNESTQKNRESFKETDSENETSQELVVI